MTSKFPPNATDFCINSLKIESTTPEKVNKCVESQGEELLHDQGVITEKLDPPHTFVPWIIFNDVFSEKELVQGTNNLTWVICCKHLHGGDKCEGYPQYCV